jgi:hypothetical protein
MTKKILLGAVVVILAGAALLYGLGIVKLNLGAHAGICQRDEEIAPPTRAAIEAAAMTYVRTVLSADPASGYAMMTKEVQAASTPLKFTAAMMAVKAMQPTGRLQVARSYFIQSAGSGPDARTVCGPLSDSQWVSLEIKPGREQAHVEIDGQARNNGLAFTLWLLPEQGDWRVESFHAAYSSIVGLTPEMLLKRAREESTLGHRFNATMLYAGAQATVDRGPAFQLGVRQDLQQDLRTFPLPPEFQGTPPFTWKMNGHAYSVSQVTIVGVDGKLGLIFLLPQKTWTDNQAADRVNRAFLNDFIATHGDYRRAFQFLVARALKPDKSGGFGTAYETGKGFQ